MGVEHFIWFEKYRPAGVKEMSLKPAYKKVFNKFIEQGNIPHLLFFGPQGSGKTTMAYVLLESIPCTKLILNASSADRGIETIKGKVKTFAQSQGQGNKLKVVLLDEADALTPDAQRALRNTMETYAKNCRFILTANYPDKIIKPIHSRCQIFEFDRFPKKKLVKLMNNMLEKEGITPPSSQDMTTLIDRFFPDIRSVINNLQAACSSGEFDPTGFGALTVDPKLICRYITNGAVTTLRTYIAGTIDFTFVYRYMFDTWLYELTKNQSEVASAICNSMESANVVPDREIHFVGCALEIMEEIGVKADFKK